MNNQIGLVRVDVEQRRSVPVCGIRGELDASNVDDVLAQVVAAVPNDAPGLALDLTHTEYVDSAGVRILFELARRLHARRQDLRLVVPPNGLVRRVLVLTALADVVPIDDEVAEAADALQRRA